MVEGRANNHGNKPRGQKKVKLCLDTTVQRAKQLKQKANADSYAMLIEQARQFAVTNNLDENDCKLRYYDGN